LTITLGAIFLGATAYEWWEMIEKHDLTISRNLFGSTYYTLVGFHGMHVTGGVIVMTIILGLAIKNQVTQKNQTGVKMVSWYWHFVDVVWIVVFTVVYIVSGNIEGPKGPTPGQPLTKVSVLSIDSDGVEGPTHGH
jgi:cytochrome c oxidase subunit 3/cytochrome o ubiquinol oxidase subunit 3